MRSAPALSAVKLKRVHLVDWSGLIGLESC